MLPLFAFLLLFVLPLKALFAATYRKGPLSAFEMLRLLSLSLSVLVLCDDMPVQK